MSLKNERNDESNSQLFFRWPNLLPNAVSKSIPHRKDRTQTSPSNLRIISLKNEPMKPTFCNLCVITESQIPNNSHQLIGLQSRTSRSPVDIFRAQLHSVDGLCSYLFSAGGVCDSPLRQADCGPVSSLGHLYTLPSCRTPTGPRGHTVKHFLILCQESWQIKFFLLTQAQELHSIYWSRSKNAQRGSAGTKAAWWNEQIPVVCVVESPRKTPSYTKPERLFFFPY